MDWANENSKPIQASIFKCENGFGIELTALSNQIDIDPEYRYTTKKYITTSLGEAFTLITAYFKGELND